MVISGRRRPKARNLCEDIAAWACDRPLGRALLTLLLLVIVVVVVWRLAAPGERFLPEFARLLTAPRIERGLMSFFSGRSYATGRFQERDVAVRLQLKRSRYGQGYLVVAVRTGGPPDLDYDGIDARTRDEAGRRALASLAAHDLVISVENGWLKALWRPQGFLIFPGRFVEDTWRQVLDALRVVVGSLEASA
jgi:hypothetical protein